MATLTVNAVSRTGFNLTTGDVAAAVGGDQFANAGREVFYVNNGGAQITVTFVTQSTPDGLVLPDRAVVVPAGEAMVIGPFQTGIYNNTSTGRVEVTYSSVTSVTVAVLQVTPA